MKKFASLTVLLIFFWVAISGKLSVVNLIIGLVFVGLIFLFIDRDLFNSHSRPIRQILIIIAVFSVLMVTRVIEASINHLYRVLFKKEDSPKVTKVKLSTKDNLIRTLVANLVTLTPGTMTIDLRGDYLYVLSVGDIGVDAIEKGVHSSEKWLGKGIRKNGG